MRTTKSEKKFKTPWSKITGERMSFRAAEKQKSQEETNIENKNAKEAKKDLKEIIKNNKEAMEAIVKESAEVSVRMENNIEKMGNMIAVAVGKDIQTSIDKLAAAIQGMNKNRENVQNPASRQDRNNHQLSKSLEDPEDLDLHLSPESDSREARAIREEMEKDKEEEMPMLNAILEEQDKEIEERLRKEYNDEKKILRR